MLSEGNGVEYIYKQFQINYEKLLVCVWYINSLNYIYS
ncbi:hypothetical protein CBF_0068 [Clostridium botulinum F str. 230613]|nr:hypothetical protein CBF_0068 [Clostridium botulinum F str. 230613]